MFDSSPSLMLKTPTSCLYKKGYKKDYKTMKGGRRQWSRVVWDQTALGEGGPDYVIYQFWGFGQVA